MRQAAIEKYKKVQDLNWNETEKLSGKKIKIIVILKKDDTSLA